MTITFQDAFLAAVRREALREHLAEDALSGEFFGAPGTEGVASAFHDAPGLLKAQDALFLEGLEKGCGEAARPNETVVPAKWAKS